MNTFQIDSLKIFAQMIIMNARTIMERWCWRKDLSDFRGLSDYEKHGFLLLLEWFENFRLRYDWEAGREAAKAFWRAEVLKEGSEREQWQLDQWSNASGTMDKFPNHSEFCFTSG